MVLVKKPDFEGDRMTENVGLFGDIKHNDHSKTYYLIASIHTSREQHSPSVFLEDDIYNRELDICVSCLVNEAYC